MRVALIASEMAPFAKTGGLGDMVGSLGPALKRVGLDPFFILPKYRSVAGFPSMRLNDPVEVDVDGTVVKARIWEGKHPGSIPGFFIDIPEFFDRPHLYGERGADYRDNCLRFVSFCRVAMELIDAGNIGCDVLHANDWMTALIPLYLRTLYAGRPVFANTRSLLTIHNFGYQGYFNAEDFRLTGLDPQKFFTVGFLEYHGIINLLKGGIVGADAISTVSPTHAREVMTSEYGFGLEGVLQTRKGDFYGIVNGIDTTDWDPSTDPFLPAHFSSRNLDGKHACKSFVQRAMGLPERSDIPLIGMVCRFVGQKGIDLVVDVIGRMRDEDLQWMLVGSGEPALEQMALDLIGSVGREKLSVCLNFEEALAHQVEAGIDIFLMPSRYEPCGYNQLYSQRYGAVPVARATGGLIDTITDFEMDPQNGTGFLFAEASADDLEASIKKAIATYRNAPIWNGMVRRAMERDFSWDASAREFAKIYRKICDRPPVLQGTI